MARVRVAAAAVATVLALATPASAYGNDSTWHGSCRIDGLRDTLTGSGDHWTGVIYSDVMPYSETHNNVVNATVTCHLYLDGVDVLQTSGSGSGVVAFADPLSFTASPSTVVQVCAEVDFTSDPTPTGWSCSDSVDTPIEPQWMFDLVDWSFDVVNDGGLPGRPPPGPSLPRVPTGAGWNDGDTGFLALTSTAARDVAATCAFRTDRDAGTITVTGSAATARTTPADTTRVRCVLRDAATGTVLYDDEQVATGPVAAVHDTVPAIPGKVTVCTEGSGTWGADTTTVGPYCRPGTEI